MGIKKSNKSQLKYKTGRWTRAQHHKFMQALEKYGRRWVLVQRKVKTRTLLQIRSHAQKVFLNMPVNDINALIDHQSDSNISVLSANNNQNQGQNPNIQMYYGKQNKAKETSQQNNNISSYSPFYLVQNYPVLTMMHPNYALDQFCMFQGSTGGSIVGCSPVDWTGLSPGVTAGEGAEAGGMTANVNQAVVGWTPIFMYSYQQ